MEMIEEIKILSEQEFFGCIQCGVCTSSCPVFSDLNLKTPPRMISKILVEGDENKIFSDIDLVKYCINCQICGARCPKNIDVSRMVDALRFYIVKRSGKDLLEPLRERLKEAPQIAFLEITRLLSRIKELSEVKKIPLNKLQRSDEIWDLEIKFVEKLLEAL